MKRKMIHAVIFLCLCVILISNAFSLIRGKPDPLRWPQKNYHGKLFVPSMMCDAIKRNVTNITAQTQETNSHTFNQSTNITNQSKSNQFASPMDTVPIVLLPVMENNNQYSCNDSCDNQSKDSNSQPFSQQKADLTSCNTTDKFDNDSSFILILCMAIILCLFISFIIIYILHRRKKSLQHNNNIQESHYSKQQIAQKFPQKIRIKHDNDNKKDTRSVLYNGSDCFEEMIEIPTATEDMQGEQTHTHNIRSNSGGESHTSQNEGECLHDMHDTNNSIAEDISENIKSKNVAIKLEMENIVNQMKETPDDTGINVSAKSSDKQIHENIPKKQVDEDNNTNTEGEYMEDV